MFCKKCGHEIAEGTNFCANCGAKVTPDYQASPGGHPQGFQKPDNWQDPQRQQELYVPGNPQKPKGSAKVIAAVAAVVILLAAGWVLYATLGLSIQKDKLADSIEKSGISEYQGKKDGILGIWDTLGITDVSDKKEVIRALKLIHKKVEDFEKCAADVKKLQGEKEQYHMEDEVYGSYESLLNKCQEAVDNKDAGNANALLEEAQSSKKTLIKTNNAYIDEQIAMYKSADLGGAEQSVMDDYQKNLEEINKLAGSDKRDYQAMKQAFSKMDEAIYLYIEPKNLLDVNIQQVDVTEFPKVKLYLSIRDQISGEIPENLENSMFYIKKENAKAEYIQQVINTVSQLNEKEALKIDMVADVSGSMDGTPLNEAKEIMRNFIGSVQFAAGDMVELTSFATGVRLEQEFCSDASLLTNEINGLYTGDMTSLFDALYTSVERVAAQSGAKCVIAFTDGDDNYSSCTREDVVKAAQRYHVPVFIIGIGSGDYYDADYIAQQTGGMYFNINDVYSMENIYEEIYRMEKEMYLIEFQDTSGIKVTDVSNIEAGYRSVEYGGECRYTYTPKVLLSVDGSGFYQDGPEAVVEKYLKGFGDAVTKSDFSYIADCLKKGSAIYNEQKSYVKRNITAQLSSFEIVSVDYKSKKKCVVKTRETYFVQVDNEALQLMTQECKYALEKGKSKWQMTAFADKVKVLSRIKQ
ncbi:VWA domain-containing protein [Lachnospiraceae bacterium 48-42]